MGKKLTIYMLDGIPTGGMTVEIGNWSGKAVFSPRSRLKKLLERHEFDSPGVYFLKSESDDPDFNDSIYIGEAEVLRVRLKNHIANRDFQSVICFISKDEMLTKAHIKFLESRLASLAKEANASKIENANHPTLPHLSEADVSDMEYFIEQITFILPSVGIHTLVRSVDVSHTSQNRDTSQVVYKIKSPSITARMIETDLGFVVLKGSEASMTVSDSISEGWIRLRTKLTEAGLLINKGGKLIFTDDAVFESPSAASSVVLGRQSPGPIVWIDSQGHTYKDNQEQPATADGD